MVALERGKCWRSRGKPGPGRNSEQTPRAEVARRAGWIRLRIVIGHEGAAREESTRHVTLARLWASQAQELAAHAWLHLTAEGSDDEDDRRRDEPFKLKAELRNAL